MPILLAHAIRSVAVVSLLASCAVTLGYTASNPPPHALSSRAPESVEIHTATSSDRPFVDIGVYEATIDSIGDDRDKVMKRMRVAAGRRGCDALLVDAAVAAPTPAGPSVDTLYRATCIVYR
jgi:hypothetical protein